MAKSTLLVDPLAAFFRTGLVGLPPLVLDETEIEVQMVAPLAHISTVRRFMNSSDTLIEAVLTLPPLAPHEILYRLVVRINGVEYSAAPQSAGRARQAHDAAVADGLRAILYELLEHDVPLISITGIEPGARVEILTWSIRPLARPEENRATLVIHLSAASSTAPFRLADADAAVTTPERHSASLIVSAEAKRVTISGQPYPDRDLTAHEPIGVECSTPIALEIVALEGGSLDHCEWQVDRPGGWEVTSQRGIETFRHPSNPEGSVVSDRDDWIFGIVRTAAGEIRVTAPLPSDGTIAPGPHGMLGIAHNARGMRAFAAAGFVEAATPQTPAAVLLAANVLSRRTSLAFVGPEGELPDEIPTLRKVALAGMETINAGIEPPHPVALEPFPYEAPPALKLPALPSKNEDIKPGAKPPRRWTKWVPAVLALVAMVAAFQSIDVPLPPKLIAFVGLMLLGAMPFLPREGSPARRRLPLLTVLLLPWIGSLLAGPMMDDLTYGFEPPPAWMIPFQYGLLAASAMLPFVLMPIMRDARRFTAVLGILNFVLTLFMVASSVLILTPGS